MEKRALLMTATLVALLGSEPARAQSERVDPDVQKLNELQSEPESVSEDVDMSAAPPAKTSNGITYRTGGVGKEERDALHVATKSYPLKVVLAGSGEGAFVADATLRIADSGGRTLLEASEVGPLFFADVPSGTYTIEAALRGQAQKKSVSVKKGKQTAVQFRW